MLLFHFAFNLNKLNLLKWLRFPDIPCLSPDLYCSTRCRNRPIHNWSSLSVLLVAILSYYLPAYFYFYRTCHSLLIIFAYDVSIFSSVFRLVSARLHGAREGNESINSVSYLMLDSVHGLNGFIYFLYLFLNSFLLKLYLLRFCFYNYFKWLR